MSKKIVLALAVATLIATQAVARPTFHEGYYSDSAQGCMFQGYPCGDWSQYN